MKNYTFKTVCPNTGENITSNEVVNSGGVCPRCGDVGGLVCHTEQEIGQWERYGYMGFGIRWIKK